MKEGALLKERSESEVKVVGAAANHPGGALELDARLDGESCSDDDWRRDKDREGGGRGLDDRLISLYSGSP